METLTLNKNSNQESQTEALSLPLYEDSPLEKLDFEGLDPRFSDVVYHSTKQRNMEGIGDQGLLYSDGSSRKDGLLEDMKLMARKPEDIPIDLQHVVFGQLEPRHFGSWDDMKHGGVTYQNANFQGELLAVAVDPYESYVGDANTREWLWEIERRGLKRENPDFTRDNFWKGCIPLSVFRNLYKPEYAQPKQYIRLDGKLGSILDGVSWEAKDENAMKLIKELGLPTSYTRPEVYIPVDPATDTVPVDRIKHTASSLLTHPDINDHVRNAANTQETIPKDYPVQAS